MTLLDACVHSIICSPLAARGAEIPLKKPLDAVIAMSADIAKKHTSIP